MKDTRSDLRRIALASRRRESKMLFFKRIKKLVAERTQVPLPHDQ
jgi:hypothetical protein